MNFQDFNTTILKKKVKINKVVPINPDKKIEEKSDEGDFKLQRYDDKWIRKLIEFRAQRGWKQEDFAPKLKLQLPFYKKLELNQVEYRPSLVDGINSTLVKLEKQYPPK